MKTNSSQEKVPTVKINGVDPAALKSTRGKRSWFTKGGEEKVAGVRAGELRKENIKGTTPGGNAR